MSKYIIDIPDNVKKIVYFHVGNANAVWTTSNVLDDLELLTTDYINEHFGELQDTAYQKGFEDGKAQAERGCKGCKYEGKTGEHLPCDYCMNNFRSQWTAEPKPCDIICDIIRNGIQNWITELNVRAEDIGKILEDMRHD